MCLFNADMSDGIGVKPFVRNTAAQQKLIAPSLVRLHKATLVVRCTTYTRIATMTEFVHAKPAREGVRFRTFPIVVFCSPACFACLGLQSIPHIHQRFSLVSLTGTARLFHMHGSRQ